MKKLFVFLTFIVFWSSISFSQDMGKYQSLIKEAEALYDSKDFEKSAEKYDNAFVSIDNKAYPNDRYNAACSYALSKNKEKAFYHLFKLTDNDKIKYNNYDHIIKDTDLDLLHKDKRWEKLIEKVKANKFELEKDYDHELITVIDKVFDEDQTYRRQLNSIEKEYGKDSPEMEKQWAIIQEKDSINLITVSKILDERGWLGSNIIGGKGNSTLFLVIQHSPLEVQQKYLPMMRDAVKKGNANSSSLALLEDRVALRTGNKQIYGSQIGRDKETGEFYVSPLIDPENVDKRRAEVGLGPISDYIKTWNLTWDVQKHIEQTKKIEAQKK